MGIVRLICSSVLLALGLCAGLYAVDPEGWSQSQGLLIDTRSREGWGHSGITVLDTRSREGWSQSQRLRLDTRSREGVGQSQPFALNSRAGEGVGQSQPLAADFRSFGGAGQSQPLAVDFRNFGGSGQSSLLALDTSTREGVEQSPPFSFDLDAQPPVAGDPCDDSGRPGLNFCGANGGGSFEQQILEQAVVDVPGIIPVGIGRLYIGLRSDEDVDIQLFDQEDGTAIVKWPDGLMNGPTSQAIQYQGSEINYSGYNGDGTGLGHEFIALSGTTKRPLVMKAFGYQAGFATVEYEWERKINGSFEQEILRDAVIDVPGELAEGITNIAISLRSDEDVDIQLYDKLDGTAIVKWPDGLMNGPQAQSLDYQGMKISYSGYNGDGSGRGHEFIEVMGRTTRPLVMKAFGYRAGFATVGFENLVGVGPAVKWAGGDPEERPLPGAALPTDYALEENAPNPFNSSTQIKYQLPESNKVSLIIYNILGQPIRRLVDTDQVPGFYRVLWDGTDASRNSVASGVYFYRLVAGKRVFIKRMLLVQ